jgi:hypothetical protein
LNDEQEETDRELWRGSESPVEIFDSAGADEDGNWQVDIIGEEVDHLGTIMCVCSHFFWFKCFNHSLCTFQI